LSIKSDHNKNPAIKKDDTTASMTIDEFSLHSKREHVPLIKP
jgi:hypothetical protein